MDLEYINVNQICSIKIIFANVNNNYHYKKQRVEKSFFRKDKVYKEGFYYWDGNLASIENLRNSESVFIKGELVFNKPRIIINMSNGDSHEKIFNVNKDMFEFMCKRQLSTIAWINKKDILERRDVLLEKYVGYSDEYRILANKSLLNKEYY